MTGFDLNFSGDISGHHTDKSLDNSLRESSGFAERLLAWFDCHGRHDLPWQKDITPYRVWLSEIMLQQTQVATVIPYFERFTRKYPSLKALARGKIDDVLHLWTGLGYYARARNLHKAAQQVVNQFDGELPSTVAELCTLPGIGQSTAGAIVSIAFKQRATILDGNVKRVIARHQAIPGWPGQAAVHKKLWQVAETCTPHSRFAEYTQAIMDLGATLCTRSSPACDDCPVQQDCKARLNGTIDQLPGKKPKKALPVKKAYWLVIQTDANSVILENRPPSGLWGGLWTFPEVEHTDQITSKCQELGANYKDHRSLRQQRHTFSHFHLDYTPLIVRASLVDKVADGESWRSFKADRIDSVGLPAPVKKLLASLSTQDLLS